jgi:DNA-binding CsgD family transcriptional regulator
MRKGNIVAAVACGPGEESPIYLGGSPASPRGTPLEHLLEREAELERIVRAAARSVEGEPALVVVEGAAGLGKTALLLEARRRLRQAPTTVLAGRPGEQEVSFAYGVLRQLLGPLLAAVSPEERETVVSGPAARALAALGDGESQTPSFDVSFGILDALYWLTANLSVRGPLALFVDDAHWADSPSLRFLAHLLRRMEGLRIAVVVALRPGEPGAPDALLDTIRLDPLAEVLTLLPLSERAVGRIVRLEVTGSTDAAFRRACYRACAGNPLYLRELILALKKDELPPTGEAVERVAARWPASIARHVLRRVAAVGPDATALASAMAVLGEGGALAHATRIAQLDDAGGWRLARVLREMDILAGEDPITFRHPIVRLALQSDLAADRREELLRAAVKLLTAEDAPSEQVARYLLALRPGGGHPIEPLRSAASVARARGAPDLAGTYLRRALAEPPPEGDRVAILHELGMVEEMLGDEACLKHLAAARDGTADPQARVGWTIDLANAFAMLGRLPEAVAVIEGELVDGRLADDRSRELFEAYACALALWNSDGNPRAQALLRRFRDQPPRHPEAARLALAARAARFELPARQTAELALEALAGDALLTAPWIGNLLAIAALIFADAFGPASAMLERALRLAKLSGNNRAIGNVHAQLATLSYAVGDLAACETQARTHLGPLRGDMGWEGAAYTVAVLVRALTKRGDLDQAERLLADASPEPWPPNTNLHVFLRAARGELRCAQGRLAEGVADLAAARRRLMRVSGFCGAAFAALGESEPLALERLGRRVEAQALLADSLPRARRCGAPRNLGVTLRTASLFEGQERGILLAREAVEVLEGSGARLELAQALINLGMLLRHAGRRMEARRHLATGLDLARRCGVRPLAERAREELRASGARPRRDRLTGPDALTPSELRLARLAADGRTNRQIAQELYLSEKTVEMHLGRAYHKLGIRGRGELTVALDRTDSLWTGAPS